MEENIDYVVCKICDKQYLGLGQHIKCKHGITVAEYKKRYPDTKIFCEIVIKGISKNVSGKNNTNWKGGILEKQQRQKQDEFENGIENIDYVICQECNKRFKQITTNHLKMCSDKCNNTTKYKELYPNSRLAYKKRKSHMRKLTRENLEKSREFGAINAVIAKSKNIHTIYREYGDGSTASLCACGCGKEVGRSKLYPYMWNKYVYHHYDNREDMKKMHKKWKRRDGEKYYEHCAKGGRISHKKQREENLEEYLKKQSRATKAIHTKHPDFASKNAKRIHKMYPDLGFRCAMGRLKNQPYRFMDVRFNSGQERDVAILRFKLLGIIPIVYENCHIKISNKEFDFKQFEFIHEYHPYIQPYNKSMSKEEYYRKRRKVMDSNGHRKSELIVTETIEETKKMYDWLIDKLDINIFINEVR